MEDRERKNVSYKIISNGKVVNQKLVSNYRVNKLRIYKQKYTDFVGRVKSEAAKFLNISIAKISGLMPKYQTPKWLRKIKTKFNLLINPISVKDKALFSRQFATLVDAGVPMIKSLEILARQCPNLRMKRIVKRINLSVADGTDLSTAMRQHPECFDVLYVAMVEAGETGGVLGDVLNRLSKILEDMSNLKNKIKSALAYPIAVGVLAVGVFFVMTAFLIPIFAEIFKKLGSELPPLTLFMLGLSKLITSWLIIIPIIIGAGLIWCLRKYYQSPEGRMVYDRSLLKIPVLGDLIEKVTIARFCRVFGTLARSGVPIITIIPILEATVGNMAIAQAISKAEVYVKEGVQMSEALKKQKVFPELVYQMIGVGEEAGELDMMLLKIADFYESEVDQAVKALTSLLEPIMMVFIAGMVAVILLSMYLPMFKIFDKIG
ncbi:type II secretion system F family protein [Chamaesiphon sp.]|uniref:type II secretion system F family protein n=1 Tax=Chamaesiphon sp. TaxID=2814140 RepID=UPI00359317EA